MLVGSLAITLNLMSVALLAFFIGVVVLSVSAPLCFSKLSHFTFRIRKLALWLLATGPWWIGAICVAIFWPRVEGGLFASWIANFAHWHHADLFTFTSWHGLTLLVCSLILTWMLVVIVIQSRKKSLSMDNLLELCDTNEMPNHNSHQVYSLQLTIPTAFTSGLLSPKVYLTTALQKQVDQQALDIIIQHELAHVRAYDPLFKMIFALFCRFYPKSVNNILMQHYSLLTEQMADHAVTHFHDSLNVAQTLINVAKLQQKLPINCDGMQLSYFANEQISQRVYRLVSPLEKTPVLALVVAIAAFIGAPLFAVSTVDSFHHFIETFFTH
ncbi:peptidase M56, BlaR1 [Paraglaciecola mesophila KMM 241]|uniref:Peptidase M56, BlaR1 n=1 Tax=Paraglaciecola mesophila KMM 241 TaxID=1128912 RepID=K6ZTF0_9ALTE|nr:M56 family metallopeptidase [Paraglaciecola mesophila]GAC26590.1 peptidase M56, BlaR1 [Paraglaciecola mesophila KMM 241]